MRRPRDGELTYILSEDKDVKPTQQNERVIYLSDFNEKIRQLLLSKSVEDEKHSGKRIIKARAQTTKELINILQMIEKFESDPLVIKHKIIDAFHNGDNKTAFELRRNLPKRFRPEVKRTLAAFGFRGRLINNNKL